MDEYQITISDLAYEDMVHIKRYIRDELRNPEAAEKIIEDFYEQIGELKTMPKRFELIGEDILPNFFRMRSVIVGNYFIFYRCMDLVGKISIDRVLYKRRDWKNLF